MEILITALIVIAVVFILYKNFKKSSKGIKNTAERKSLSDISFQ